MERATKRRLLMLFKTMFFRDDPLFEVRFPGEHKSCYIQKSDFEILTLKDQAYVIATLNLDPPDFFTKELPTIISGLEFVSGPHQRPKKKGLFKRLFESL